MSKARPRGLVDHLGRRRPSDRCFIAGFRSRAALISVTPRPALDGRHEEALNKITVFTAEACQIRLHLHRRWRYGGGENAPYSRIAVSDQCHRLVSVGKKLESRQNVLDAVGGIALVEDQVLLVGNVARFDGASGLVGVDRQQRLAGANPGLRFRCLSGRFRSFRMHHQCCGTGARSPDTGHAIAFAGAPEHDPFAVLFAERLRRPFSRQRYRQPLAKGISIGQIALPFGGANPLLQQAFVSHGVVRKLAVVQGE